MGLVTPGRTGGGGRRYSGRDLERLRTIAELTASGIGIEGVRRLLELENQLAALQARNEELTAELAATQEALRAAIGVRRRAAPVGNLPALRTASAGSVVVWRRNQG